MGTWIAFIYSLVVIYNAAVDIGLSKLWEIVKDREAWHATVHGITVWHDLVTE